MEKLLVTVPAEITDHVATGAKMRELRKAAGETLRVVSDRMGVSQPFVSDLESGRRNWTEERAQAFLAALQPR